MYRIQLNVSNTICAELELTKILSKAKMLRINQSNRRLKIKLQRAYGGCLGTKRRRRTWPTAKSHGEL